MKMQRKLFLLGVILIGLAMLFSHYYRSVDFTGLFGLGAEKEEKQKETEIPHNISPGLSFTVLKPTTLEASLSNAKLQNCPGETEAEILVKNTGQSQAENLFIKFGPGIKVIACNNCRLGLVEPGQEVLARAVLCLESAQPNSLTVGSANSNRIELLLE